MTTTKTKTPAASVSQAKPKAAAKKPSAADKAKAAVEKMRQATLSIPMPEPVAEIMMLPIELVQVQKQVRTEFNEETIRELAEDIAERGVIQPILVRAIDGGYLVVAGERRYRAAKLAQLPTVPAIVSSIDDDTAAAVQIAENIQREDLSLADTAAAVRKLYELHGNSVTVTAEKLHKSKAWVSKHLAASCPDLRHMAREILEGGYSEDLEIILTLDKYQTLDWCGCRDLCELVKAGKAGRQTVRETYEAAKKRREEIEERRREEIEAANDPEAVERRKAEQERFEQERAEQRERQRLDPATLRWKYDEELEDDERGVLKAHLEDLHRSGEYTEVGKMVAAVIRMSAGNYSNIELAAFIAGNQGIAFDLAELIRQTMDAENEERDK